MELIYLTSFFKPFNGSSSSLAQSITYTILAYVIKEENIQKLRWWLLLKEELVDWGMGQNRLTFHSILFIFFNLVKEHLCKEYFFNVCHKILHICSKFATNLVLSIPRAKETRDNMNKFKSLIH